MKTLHTLGATAKVSLPELNIKNLHARVDTGAATCALHASTVEFNDELNELRVILFDPDNDLYTGEVLVFKDFVVRNVRNSFGKRHARPMIETEVVVQGHSQRILLGFSNRSKLTYDMLIGRNLLELGYLVDVSK